MYTYAFFPTANTPVELPEGIANSLQLVTVDQLTALVEPELSMEILQSSDDLLMQAVLCHDQVIREVFEQTPLLPLRFGTYFVSRQGLIEHLETHHTEYLEKLAKITGQAEFLLKLKPVATPEFAIPNELKGRDYFLAKKQQYQLQTDWQQEQQTELQDLLDLITQSYLNWVRTEPRDDVERIYLLGDRQQATQLQDQMLQWQPQCSHWEMSLGEALPPYHFV